MAPKKIMVVDDEQATVKMIKMRLEKSGYEVTGVTESQKALGIARIEKPDLIILDILMPELDGMELGGLLKTDPVTKDIPIIFLTALKRKEEETSIRNKDKIILAKPFEPADLLAEIERLVNR